MPEVQTGAKGKQRRLYRWYATPWEILRQLPEVVRSLRPGGTIERLNEIERAETDTAAARRMQTAKQKLFASFQRKKSACAKAVEMPGRGQRGKPTPGFPLCPPWPSRRSGAGRTG